MIGALHSERHACGDVHLPNCYNPWHDTTACTCGEHWWHGRVGAWYSRLVREPAPQPLPSLGVGVGAVGLREPERKILGWDRYFLHLAGCTDDRIEPDPDHRCTDATEVSAAEMWGAS